MKAAILRSYVPPNAPADERDILVQAAAAKEALQKLRWETAEIELTFDMQKAADEIVKFKPAVVFNLVDSINGQGRGLEMPALLLDYLKIPYTGCGAEGLFISSSKAMTKKTLEGAQIPTPKWHTLSGLQNCKEEVKGRFIIKAVWEHASVGLDEDSVAEVENAAQLAVLLEARRKTLGECIAEEFIDGREFNISLLETADGPTVLPPAEIKFVGYGEDKPKVVGYRAKWVEDSYEYANTPREFDFPPEDADALKAICDAAVKTWNAAMLSGYARVDFRLAADGAPYVVDINSNPCISPDAGFFAAAQKAGYSYEMLIEEIVLSGLAAGRLKF